MDENINLTILNEINKGAKMGLDSITYVSEKLEQEDMKDKYYEIIKVKPGLTGYWQVNGRSDVDFNERLEMDTYYIQNRTLWLDFKILVKTVLKVFGKEGGAL